MRKGTSAMTWVVVALVGVGLSMCSPAWGAEKGKGEKGFGARVGYFDPSESGLDAKVIFGLDYWPNEKMRISVERWLQRVYMGEGVWIEDEILPVTVSWITPGKDLRKYYGYGVGWYKNTVTASDQYESLSVSGSDLGFHALAGQKQGEKGFIEVKYSVADVTVNVEGFQFTRKVGGLTLAYGMRF